MVWAIRAPTIADGVNGPPKGGPYVLNGPPEGGPYVLNGPPEGGPYVRALLTPSLN